MIRELLGRKIGMTQIFDPDGNVIPVTVVEAGPCPVLALPRKDLRIKKVRIGFDPVRESRLRQPEIGFFKKIGVSPVRFTREVEVNGDTTYEVGQQIKADVFRPGDFVDVQGISKGKGFAGGMERWNWSGGGAGHGSMHHRRIGSAGSSADPSRTFRGHHMPGHLGAVTVSVQGLRVMQVDVEKNLLLIKGAVPGFKRAYVVVRLSKKRAFVALDQKKAVTVKSRNPMKQSKGKVTGKG